MAWGIVIDPERDGFSLGEYEPFNAAPSSGVNLIARGATEDDFFVRASQLTANTSSFMEPPASGGAPGGSGTMVAIRQRSLWRQQH